MLIGLDGGGRARAGGDAGRVVAIERLLLRCARVARAVWRVAGVLLLLLLIRRRRRRHWGQACWLGDVRRRRRRNKPSAAAAARCFLLLAACCWSLSATARQLLWLLSPSPRRRHLMPLAALVGLWSGRLCRLWLPLPMWAAGRFASVLPLLSLDGPKALLGLPRIGLVAF